MHPELCTRPHELSAKETWGRVHIRFISRRSIGKDSRQFGVVIVQMNSPRQVIPTWIHGVVVRRETRDCFLVAPGQIPIAEVIALQRDAFRSTRGIFYIFANLSIQRPVYWQINDESGCKSILLL